MNPILQTSLVIGVGALILSSGSLLMLLAGIRLQGGEVPERAPADAGDLAVTTPTVVNLDRGSVILRVGEELVAVSVSSLKSLGRTTTVEPLNIRGVKANPLAYSAHGRAFGDVDEK